MAAPRGRAVLFARASSGLPLGHPRSIRNSVAWMQHDSIAL